MSTKQFQFITLQDLDLDDYNDRANEIADAAWPEFMLYDPVAGENWHELYGRFSEYQFALMDTSTDRMVAMGNSLPFFWDKPIEDLPEGGWDWVFLKAIEDNKIHKQPNIQSAIQVAIHPDYQGQGISSMMVNKMRSVGRAKGFKTLVAPVRPSQKSQYPLTSIDDYITWTDDHGLPFDAWLRVHTRLGGKIIKPCHQAMTITGSCTDWVKWTNLKYPQSGQYIIQGALNPIKIDVEKDKGVYIEPNVWMHHSLA